MSMGSAAMMAGVVSARRKLAARIAGSARERLDALGDRVVAIDLYSVEGADIYHKITKNDRSEIREMLAAVSTTTGPVLELAAGTGRLTFPLLAAGREVTAIDSSSPMLDILKRELARRPKQEASLCKVVRFDMTQLRIRRRDGFAAAVLGGSSVSLLDAKARRKTFERVAHYLEDSGVFVVSTATDSTGDGSVGQRQEETVTPLDDGTTVYEYWPHGSAERVVTVVPKIPDDGPVFVYVSIIRVLPVEALQDELTECGFEIQTVRKVGGGDEQHPMAVIEAVKSA